MRPEFTQQGGAVLRTVAPLLALAAACGGDRERPGVPPRHLLVVTVDTLRADHLGAFGYARATSRIPATPEQHARGEVLSLDDLAAQGVLFANAFAPRGQTAPAIATLFSGRPPLETCVIDNRDTVPADIVTLAELLRERGFRTAAFTANRLLEPGSGIEQGFEVFTGHGARLEEDRDFLVVESALRWLAERQPDEQLFLWLHLIGPHMPYDPAPWREVDYGRRFADPDYAGPASGTREWLDRAYAEGTPLSAADLDHVVALYDGEVARVNALLQAFFQMYAQVFDATRTERWDDTLLVFAADHGEELHQRHGYFGHSKSVYSSVLHVPLFVRHPRSLTGARVLDEVVELQDVLPTVLEWLDVPAPAGVRGRSLLPLVDSYVRRPFESRPAFGAWSDQIFTARDARWRLVWNPDGVEPADEPPGPYPVPALALFDVERDPLERFDVSGAHPEVVEELRAGLRAWLDGLAPCVVGERGITAERQKALKQLGY